MRGRSRRLTSVHGCPRTSPFSSVQPACRGGGYRNSRWGHTMRASHPSRRTSTVVGNPQQCCAGSSHGFARPRWTRRRPGDRTSNRGGLSRHRSPASPRLGQGRAGHRRPRQIVERPPAPEAAIARSPGAFPHQPLRPEHFLRRLMRLLVRNLTGPLSEDLSVTAAHLPSRLTAPMLSRTLHHLRKTP